MIFALPLPFSVYCEGTFRASVSFARCAIINCLCLAAIGARVFLPYIITFKAVGLNNFAFLPLKFWVQNVRHFFEFTPVSAFWRPPSYRCPSWQSIPGRRSFSLVPRRHNFLPGLIPSHDNAFGFAELILVLLPSELPLCFQYSIPPTFFAVPQFNYLWGQCLRQTSGDLTSGRQL